MKKSNILILFLFLIVLFGCNEKNEIKKFNYNHFEVRSYLNKENNWIYYFNITYDNNGVIKEYNFNGINTKLISDEDFYLPVYNDDKIVDKLNPECICLNYYQKYKNEFNAINDYFNEMKFSNIITLDDLDDLKISYYKKDDLVLLFNKAISIDFRREKGNYDYSLNVLNYANQTGSWHVVTDGSFSYIEIIDIDYIFNDGSYLSDIALKNDYYNIVYNEIINIENDFINNQRNNYIYSGDIKVENFLKDLYPLLDSLKNDNY